VEVRQKDETEVQSIEPLEFRDLFHIGFEKDCEEDYCLYFTFFGFAFRMEIL
jgi:hypothetical protein